MTFMFGRHTSQLTNRGLNLRCGASYCLRKTYNTWTGAFLLKRTDDCEDRDL